MSTAAPLSQPSLDDLSESRDMFDTSPAAIERLLEDHEALKELFEAYEKLLEEQAKLGVNGGSS